MFFCGRNVFQFSLAKMQKKGKRYDRLMNEFESLFTREYDQYLGDDGFQVMFITSTEFERMVLREFIRLKQNDWSCTLHFETNNIFWTYTFTL